MSYRDKFFSGYFSYMENALDALLMQRRAISQNIANANNPNYHPIHVKFQDQLEKMYYGPNHLGGVLKKDDDLQIDPIQFNFDPEFKAEDSSVDRLEPVVTRDMNNRVDLNHEMGELYKTQLLYNVIAENGRPNYGKDVLDIMLK